MTIVETVGVCQRGLTRPNAEGIERQRAIESVVRAVGRIVVCVDAAAERQHGHDQAACRAASRARRRRAR